MAKELQIIVKEVKFKNEEGKETKFLAYTTFTKTNERLDVRFVKDATALAPKENCVIVVDEKDMNISRKYRFPRLYVQAIKEIKPVEHKEQELPF